MDASKANQPPSSIPPSQPVNPYSQDGVVVSAVDLYARQGYEGIPDNYIMPVAGPRLSFSFPAYGKERIESEAPLDEKSDRGSMSQRNSDLLLSSNDGRPSLETFRAVYGNQLTTTPPPFINPQVPVYGSMDNLFAEPYQGDARASFNSRTQLVPIPVNASIENLLSLHESHSTDWGRPSLNLPIGDASLREKREGGDAEITPDPAFFNHFLQSGVTTPPPHEEAPLPEGRSSALSSGDPDMTSLSFPQTFADRSSMAGRERLSAGSGMRAGLRDDDDKRRLKLERNRESARMSRKRRKDYQRQLDSNVEEIGRASCRERV